MLALNCNMTKMSVIDINGVLSFFDLAAKGGAPGTQVRHTAYVASQLQRLVTCRA